MGRLSNGEGPELTEMASLLLLRVLRLLLHVMVEMASSHVLGHGAGVGWVSFLVEVNEHPRGTKLSLRSRNNEVGWDVGQ